MKAITAKKAPAKQAATLDLASLLGVQPVTAAQDDKPILKDKDGNIAKLTSAVVRMSREMGDLEVKVKLAKADLVHAARLQYYPHCAGKTEIPTSMRAVGLPADPKQPTVTEDALCVFQNRYGAVTEPEEVQQIIGPELYAKYFAQSFEIKVDGDLIPQKAAPDLLKELGELFAKHGAKAALSFKVAVKPISEFHTARHTALSEAQNLAVDKFAPQTIAVKTVGVK